VIWLGHHTPNKKKKKIEFLFRLLKIKVSIEIWSASTLSHLRTTLGKGYGLKVWCYLEHLGGENIGNEPFWLAPKKKFKTLGSPKNRIQLGGLKIGNGGWCVHGSQWPYIHGYGVWPRVSISTHGCGGGEIPPRRWVDLRHHTISIGPLEFFKNLEYLHKWL